MTSVISPSSSGVVPPSQPPVVATGTPDPDPNGVLIGRIKSALPPELGTWVDQYGPSFLVMSENELKAWVLLAVSGNSYEAYRTIAQAMPKAQLLSEWNRTGASWTALNEANAQRMTESRAALNDVVNVLLKIGIAALATA